MSASCKIVVRWMPQHPIYDKSTLVQLWCSQVTSHYLNQCWPRSPTPYDTTRPQWVNLIIFYPGSCQILHLLNWDGPCYQCGKGRLSPVMVLSIQRLVRYIHVYGYGTRTCSSLWLQMSWHPQVLGCQETQCWPQSWTCILQSFFIN